MLLKDNEQYRIVNCDCIPHMLEEMPGKSVDFAIFSPPFPSLYAYTSEAGDIGNTDTVGDEAKLHLSFMYRGLARVLKPGRVALVHVCQIPRMKRNGEVGLCDFRGLNIRAGERAGLIYEYDWAIRKNPQSQALRTRSRELQFAGLESDRAKSRGAILDYMIKFTAPGVNEVPIRDWHEEYDAENKKMVRVKHHDTQVNRNTWIEWAEGAWMDIRETDTLNLRGTKGESDTKHICPLQLSVIERGVRLYTNPGETVFTPFAGIGSEIYTALKFGRRGYGTELKPEYCSTGHNNCRSIIKKTEVRSQSLYGDAVDDDENFCTSSTSLENA